MNKLYSLLLTFLLCAAPAWGQMCEVKLTSPTTRLGSQGKQKVYLEAAFSETYTEIPLPLEPVQRPPMNVGFVQDVSGSMDGEPMAESKQAIITILNNLFPGDVVSVTVFNERATVLLPFAQIGGANSANLRDGVNKIDSGGGTNLYSGVEAGGKTVLNNRGTNFDNCLVVVSDGASSETPEFMENVGRKLAEADIRVICIGLSYDNPLLQALANGNGGEYHKISDADELAMILMTALEKNDINKTAAFDNRFALKLAPGVTLTRSTARILGSKTFKDKSSIHYFYRFGLPEKSVYTEVFEVEVFRVPKPNSPLAAIEVSYIDGTEVKLNQKRNLKNPAVPAGNPPPRVSDENQIEANPVDNPNKNPENLEAKAAEAAAENPFNQPQPQDPVRLDLKNMNRSRESASLSIPYSSREKTEINPDFYIECRIRFEVACYDALYVMACKGSPKSIHTVIREHITNISRDIKQSSVEQAENLLRQFKQNSEDLLPLLKSGAGASKGNKGKALRRGEANNPAVPRQNFAQPDEEASPFVQKLNTFRRDLIQRWQSLRRERTKPAEEAVSS